jgi:hypothetical protein
MKRLLLTALLTLGLAAPAQAHTLSIPFARGGAARAARQLTAEEGGGWYSVSRCYRATSHVVYCAAVLTITRPNQVLA